MTIGENLLPEFDAEMTNTRRILERVPEDRFDWAPHNKSATLGKLANHVATLPMFVAVIVHGHGKRPAEAKSKDELLRLLDANIASGRTALAEVTDEYLLAVVPVGRGVTMQRAAMLRTRVLSHLIHHRAQLTVYLRLLEVAVPRMYGPSADEQ